MPPLPTDPSARAGTLGGTLLVVLVHISSQEVLKTIVLAAIGAVVSFGVSWMMRFLVGNRKK